MSICELPLEVLKCIFDSLLDDFERNKTLIRCRRVCKLWNAVLPTFVDDIMNTGLFVTTKTLEMYPNLKSLDLKCSGDTLRDEDLKYASKLEHLDLEFNPNITNEGLKHLPYLKSLCLGMNSITDNGIPNSLTYLSLFGKNSLTCGKILSLPSLRELYLHHPYFTGEEIQVLKSQKFKVDLSGITNL